MVDIFSVYRTVVGALITTLIALACSLAIASTTQAGEKSALPTTLRVALTLPHFIDQFDPNKSFISTHDIILQPLFDKLMKSDRHGRATMAVASSGEFSANGMSFTITLRDDSFWSTGERVVAGDYARGLKRAAMADSKTTHLMNGIANSDRWATGDYSEPLGVEAPNDTTIVLRLTKPYGFDLTNLMNIQANPYPDKPAHNGGLIQSNGPYMLDSMSAEAITLVRNPHYKGKAPHFDRIQFMGFSHDVAVDYFLSQQADILLGPLGKQKKWLLDKFKPNHIEAGLTRKYFIIIAAPSEHTPEALKNPDFRRALYFALDHESYEKSNIFISNQDRCGFIPAHTPCSEARKAVWRANAPMDTKIKEAQAIVERAGFGKNNPLKLTLVVTPAIHGYSELAGFVKSSWHEIGIHVELIEAPTYTDAMKAMKTGRYAMLINSFYHLTPQQYIYRPELFGDWTFKYGSPNDYVDDLVLRASRASDAEFADLVLEAERKMVEDMPMLPLVSDSRACLYADWLTPNQGNVANLDLLLFAPK